MAQFVNIYDVDLKKPTKPTPLRQMVCEGDANGNRVGVYVFDDGAPIMLSGSCVGKVLRADGSTVALNGVISANQAYVVLDQASCAVNGPIQVAVCWVSGTNITTLLVAYGTVVNTDTGSYVQPSDPIPDITQLLAEIERMREATDAAESLVDTCLTTYAGTLPSSDYLRTFANVAGTANILCNLAGSQWDDIPFGGAAMNMQYAGNYDLQVIWKIEGNETAYRFVNRTTKAPYMAWCVTDAAGIASELAGIDARLDDLEAEYTLEEVPLTYTDGGYINNTTGAVEAYSGWKYTDYIDISDTDALRLSVSTTATGSTNYNAIYDANQHILDKFDATAGVFKIPFNAKYVRLSVQNNKTQTLSKYRIGMRGAAAREIQENSPTYRGNIYGVDYSRTFANVAGQSNIICNLAKSQWDDIPFGGAAINTQYTSNYDLQYILKIDGNATAYRFVHRTNKTPYSDWNITNSNRYYGKKVAILGDSRSSYQGTVPSGNAYYYPRSTGAVLTSLDEMWWKRVIDHFGMTLTVNDSYSGGFVANQDGGDGANILSSNTAINNLGSTAPDIVIVYAGVNDWNNNQVALGTYDGTQTFPTYNNTFREAYAIMLSKIQHKFPSAEIWVCTNPYCCPAGTGSTAHNMPVPKAGSGGTSLDAFNDAIRDMAGIFGCHVIEFTECGVNWQNLVTYTGDYATDNGLHFNANGHALLAEQAIRDMVSNRGASGGSGMTGGNARLNFDETPTYNSDNPVTSNGIQTAIDALAAKIASKSIGPGSVIVQANTAECALPEFTLYGKSTQTGTPAPDDPANIATVGSVGSVGIVCADNAQGAGAVTTSIPTPNGLPGIPVTSGGNFTDSNGQQWICDTIDKAAGVWTQRIGKIVLDGTQTYSVSGEGGTCFYIPLNDMAKLSDYSHAIISDSFIAVVSEGNVKNTLNRISGYNDAQNQYPTANWLYFSIDGIEVTPSAAATWLTAHPATVYYVLKTPVQYRLMEKITLDGTQTYAATGSVTGGQAFYIALNDMQHLQNYSGIIACSELTTVNNGETVKITLNTVSGYKDNGSYPNANWLYFCLSGVSSVAEAVTYLTEHPITVYYPLAVPTTENVNTIGLPQLNTMRGHADSTAIYTTDAVEPEMTGKIVLDLMKVIESL